MTEYLGELNIDSVELQNIFIYSKLTTVRNSKDTNNTTHEDLSSLIQANSPTNNSDTVTDNPFTTQEQIEVDITSSSISYHDVEWGVSANNPLQIQTITIAM